MAANPSRDQKTPGQSHSTRSYPETGMDSAERLGRDGQEPFEKRAHSGRIKNPSRMYMQTSIQTEISDLRQSPLFNLSLGSKELFHSNFLAWLFESYPRESGAMLARFLENGNGDVSIKCVKREEEHLDLSIYFNNGQELVIENKVKSLPYIAQLQAYSKNSAPNRCFVLLSLARPPFAENGVI